MLFILFKNSFMYKNLLKIKSLIFDSKSFQINFILILIPFIIFILLNEQESFNVQIVSRLSPVINFISHGTFSLSDFAKNTVDKSYYNGQYYTDKPIGQTLLAIPVGLLINYIFKGQLEDPLVLYNKIHDIAPILLVTLLFIISSVYLYWVCRRIYKKRISAVFSFLSYWLASLTYLWSNTFFSHSMTSSLLLILFCLSYHINFKKDSFKTGFSKYHKQIFLFGLLSGIVFSIEIQSIVPTFILLLQLIIGNALIVDKTKRLNPKRIVIYVALGWLAGYFPSLLYYKYIYNSVFYISYSDVVGFEGMKQGFYGLTSFKISVLNQILFSEYRGLLRFSPISLLYPLSIFLMFFIKGITNAKRLFILIPIILITSFYIYLNASYIYWHGGASTGPRHLVAMTSLISIPLGSFFDIRIRYNLKLFYNILIDHLLILYLGFSIFYESVLLSITTFSPQHIRSPINEYFIPSALNPSVDNLINIFLISIITCLCLNWMYKLRRCSHEVQRNF